MQTLEMGKIITLATVILTPDFLETKELPFTLISSHLSKKYLFLIKRASIAMSGILNDHHFMKNKMSFLP